MAVNIDQQVCDGHLLKWLLAAGLAWLEENQEVVNRLNVFPVPDGDTGKNMLLTMRRAYQEITAMDEQHVGIVAEAIAQGALMGARGNSGVILSQLWRGFAQPLRGHEFFDAPLFARACESAVDMAYRSVIHPVEGTILTVAREATEAVAARADQERDLLELLEEMLKAARRSLQNTPDLLPVLKKAGVVDSGGQGLVFILEGMMRMMNGELLRHNDEQTALETHHTWQEALEPYDEEGYGYDVQFLMHGSNMDVDAVRAAIDAMGWSTLVVGDSRLIKVHVHVHDPGVPLSYAVSLGAAIDDVVVENMQQQYEQYVEDRLASEHDEQIEAREVAVITVASGDGLRQLLKGDFHAAHVIPGGQTMNPSTQDFLAAIDALDSPKVILLPNNKNVIMAAQQAASFAHGRDIRVIPSRTLPQGISAMIAYSNLEHSTDIDAVYEAMEEALSYVVSCEVTRATRDAEIDGVVVTNGDYIGLVDGSLVVSGTDLLDVMRAMLHKAGADERELVTLYYGHQQQEAQARALVDDLRADFSAQEFEIVRGDQPLYPYIISIE